MEVPPGDILKVAVSTLSAKAKLFNNLIFKPNGNVAQDQDGMMTWMMMMTKCHHKVK